MDLSIKPPVADYESFTKAVTEIIKPQLEKISCSFMDIGLLPAKYFLETPGTDWFMLVIWVKKDEQIYQINQKFGGDIGEVTDRESVEDLVSRIIQKMKEELIVH